MDWKDGVIQGVDVAELDIHEDDRGHLIELYRSDEIWPRCAMGYWSLTNSGVVRGPHEHEFQTDVFVFMPAFEIYLWDARKDSPTQGVRQKITITEGAMRVIVPPGVVHGYKCIAEEGLSGVSMNFPDRLYAGYGKNQPVDETRHENDPNSPYKLW